MLEKLIQFATKAHEGQFRFDGVTPYIEHPLEVMRRVREAGGSEDAQYVAICHDLAEDTKTSYQDLIDLGLPYYNTVHAIQILTKTEGQDYKEYLKSVKQNVLAREVKIHDMLANLSDSPTKKQVKKYAEGLTFLLF